ncbi:MAG TPA: NYN domain-containing protein [Acidimicrobiales bacterium]|nr:NYN domain-containing protein [Acidimicrobiales bacterium]
MRNGRSYHLIDLENQLGDTAWDEAAVELIAQQYHDLVVPGPDDLVFVAVNRSLAFAAKSAFPGAEVKVARGKDGADLALIFHERVDWLAERFDRVVVASGDHIFAGLLASLRLAGVETTLVGREQAISRYSRAQADTVLTLPEPQSVLDLRDDGWQRADSFALSA